MKKVEYSVKNAYFGYLDHLTKKYLPIIGGAFGLEILLLTLLYFMIGSLGYDSGIYRTEYYMESFNMFIALLAPLIIVFFIYSGAERKHAFSTNVNRRTAYFAALTTLVACCLLSAIIAIGLPQFFKMCVYAANPDAVVAPFTAGFGYFALEFLFSFMFTLAAGGAVFLVEEARLSGIKATVISVVLLIALIILTTVICVITTFQPDFKNIHIVSTITALPCCGVILLNVGAFFAAGKGDMQR